MTQSNTNSRRWGAGPIKKPPLKRRLSAAQLERDYAELARQTQIQLRKDYYEHNPKDPNP